MSPKENSVNAKPNACEGILYLALLQIFILSLSSPSCRSRNIAERKTRPYDPPIETPTASYDKAIFCWQAPLKRRD